jgi:hypothetical protein
VKLADLNPRWFGVDGLVVGVSFDCPCCAGATRLAVPFEPTFAFPGVEPHGEGHTYLQPDPHWKRAGDSFDNLTLTPSVDASKHGHWHGSIANGAAK